MKDQYLIKRRSKPESNGCWLWIGDVTNRWGYGRFGPGRKVRLAHRVSYIAFNGQIPTGLRVLHTCDVPRCVNPAHLFLGTDTDNMRDMASKGRIRGNAGKRGEANVLARLNWNAAREIRASFPNKSITELAVQFGVSRRAVRFVVDGDTWKT